MSFTLSSGLFKGIRPLGGSEPDADYYPARITKLYHESGDKADSWRIDVLIGETGFTKLDFLNLPNESLLANGSAEEKKTQRGRAGKIRQVLESLGYSAADIENNAVGEAWFTQAGRWCYVEWVPGDGSKDSYGEIQAYLTRERYDVLKAAGTKPVRAARTDSKTPSGPPPAGYQPPGAPPTPSGAPPTPPTPPTPPSPPAPPGAPPQQQYAPPAPQQQQYAPPAAPAAPPAPPAAPPAPPMPPRPPTQ